MDLQGELDHEDEFEHQAFLAKDRDDEPPRFSVHEAAKEQREEPRPAASLPKQVESQSTADLQIDKFVSGNTQASRASNKATRAADTITHAQSGAMVKSYHPIGKPAVPSHIVKKKKGTATARKSYSPLKSAAQVRKPVVVA